MGVIESSPCDRVSNQTLIPAGVMQAILRPSELNAKSLIPAIDSNSWPFCEFQTLSIWSCPTLKMRFWPAQNVVAGTDNACAVATEDYFADRTGVAFQSKSVLSRVRIPDAEIVLSSL